MFFVFFKMLLLINAACHCSFILCIPCTCFSAFDMSRSNSDCMQVLKYFTPALVLPRQIVECVYAGVCVCMCVYTSAVGKTAAGPLSVKLLVG